MMPSHQHDRLQAEADFQDRRALSTAEPRDKYYFLADRAMACHRAAIGDVAGRRVLVVGCAEGGVTPLARRGAHVVGIDISPVAIDKLRHAIEREGLSDRATVTVMDAEHVILPPGTFDLICCTGVLHHLDIARACRSWAPLLAPGGRVVMLEPMAWNPIVAVYRLLTPGARTADEHPLKPADVGVLRRFFSSVRVDGFVLTSAAGAGFAFVPRLPSVRRAIVRALEAVDRLLLLACPPLKYCCWTSVIVCVDPRRREPAVN